MYSSVPSMLTGGSPNEYWFRSPRVRRLLKCNEEANRCSVSFGWNISTIFLKVLGFSTGMSKLAGSRVFHPKALSCWNK